MPRSSLIQKKYRGVTGMEQKMKYTADYEAMLYYLYIMSDGVVSKSELELFDSICEKMALDEEEKQKAVDQCKLTTMYYNNILDIIMANSIDSGAGKGIFGAPKKKSELTRIIWNLINLGYADGDYSENEREIVNYLVKKWDISPVVFQEMVSTADTILALTNQKDWIRKNKLNEDEKTRKKQLLNSEIEKLLEDIQITIRELDM